MQKGPSESPRAPDTGGVREELGRIVASPELANSDRLVRFLTFVVEEQLAGRGGALKESLIGVEVFGRAPGYDPKVDPIVRVQARRLRAKLEAWYGAGGQTSPVRINLPKGTYAPEFVTGAAEPVHPVARRSLIWAGAGVLLLAAAVFVFRAGGPKAESSGSRIFTAYPGFQSAPAFSPDGRTLAFQWDGAEGNNTDIYVQALSADTPRRLTTAPERDRNPIWLPDGQRISFVREIGPGRFAVIVVPVLGSGEKRVIEMNGDPAIPPRIQWTAGGKSMLTSEPAGADEPSRIVEVDAESGQRRELVAPVVRGKAAGTPGDDDVALSPDGNWIAFRRRTASVVGDVFVAPAKGGAPRAITNDRTGIIGLAWTHDAKSIIVSSRRQSSLMRLWRFPLNGDAPALLTDAALGATFPAVSPQDGMIAYAARYLDANVWRIDMGGKAPAQRLIASSLLDASAQYSPDGGKIAFRSNRTGTDEIWMADGDGRSAAKLTNFGGPVTGSPRWSPDGQMLAFDSRAEGNPDVYILPIGSRQLRRLTTAASSDITPSFSADGKSVYFSSNRSGSWQVWKQALQGDDAGAKQVTFDGGFAPQESADGNWLYYAKLNADGLFRKRVDGGSATESAVVPKLAYTFWGGWALHGDTVVFAAKPASLKAMELASGAERTVQTLSFPALPWDGSVAISPDGRFALVAELEREGSEIHLKPGR